MAISSINVGVKVGDITPAISDVPDLGASPEQIDVTAIGEDERKYIQGIEDPGEIEFTCFYEKDVFDALRALSGSVNTVITFYNKPVSDSDKKSTATVTIVGEVSVVLNGFGVGDAVNFTLSIAPTSITWKKESTTSGGKEPGSGEKEPEAPEEQ